MAGIMAAVYDPPRPGLPFLGVVIMDDGSIEAVGFPTAHDAQEFVEETIGGLQDLANREGGEP